MNLIAELKKKNNECFIPLWSILQADRRRKADRIGCLSGEMFSGISSSAKH